MPTVSMGVAFNTLTLYDRLLLLLFHCNLKLHQTVHFSNRFLFLRKYFDTKVYCFAKAINIFKIKNASGLNFLKQFMSVIYESLY
jgi:hypothetical protein